MGDAEKIISVVIPTYNEVENLEPLISRLDGSLEGIEYEAIIVDDDSPDGTGERADILSTIYPLKVLHRKNKRGLSSAVLDGLAISRGEILGFMDADLSHPPETIPKLIGPIRDDGIDITIASRLVEGGGVVGQWPQHRYLNSYLGEFLARPLTSVQDSMSGFFFMRRSVLDGTVLIPRGYKIGLEILVKGNYKTVKEVPFIFDNRIRGKSKLSWKTRYDYLVHLANLYMYKFRNGTKRS